MVESEQHTRIFALHGFTGAGEDFLPLKQCCPASWQWHCPDLPGHGKNRAMPIDGKFSLSVHLDFLENERSRFVANQPCVLLGYSMGGRLALHWALKNPTAFSALILIGASPGLDNDTERTIRRKADETLAEKIVAEGIPAFQKHWWNLPLFSGLKKLPPEKIFRMEARRLQNTAPGLAASLRGIGTGALPSLWNHLSQIRMPVLCLAGALDEKFSEITSLMASRLPNSAVVLIPDTGHVTHLEASQAVAAAMQKFIKLNLALDR